MKITLAEWLKIEASLKVAQAALEAATDVLLDVSKKETIPAHILERVMETQMEIGGLAYLVHPQSEWRGGDSNDPSNHTLREPHIVGLTRRYFTQEEIEQAKMVCVGPCQWTVRPQLALAL